MAAVAGFRNVSNDRRQMHPFFQPVAVPADADLSCSELPFGMDGTIEQERTNRQEDGLASQQILSAAANSTPSSGPQTSDLPATRFTSPLPGNHGPGDDDSNEERRKRRKLSVEKKPCAIDSDQNQQIGDAVKQEQSLSQPSEILTTALLQTPLTSSQFTSPSVNAPETPRSAKRRSPRSSNKKRANRGVEASGSTIQQVETLPVQEDNSPSKGKRTPKKKMLQLSSSGKLVNSSKKSTQPQQTEQKPKTASRKIKNVQLKNGKIAQTLVAIMKYGAEERKRKEIGQKIDDILARARPKPESLHTPNVNPSKATHPFFLGKAVPRSSSTLSNAASIASTKHADSDHEGDTMPEAKKPVPWKDIVFKSSRTGISKHPQAVPAIWPPLDMQHIGQDSRQGGTSERPAKPERKQKQRKVEISVLDDENFLSRYAMNLSLGWQTNREIRPAEKLWADVQEVIQRLDQGTESEQHEALVAARQRAMDNVTAFDRAVTAGPLMWPQQLAPARWQEVLQPQSASLFEWLKGLAVHNVKQGIEKPAAKIPKKKRRPRKRDDELDDFIVTEDDDETSTTVKQNAILIVGPNGCGKTASVYAIAKQLGFEVFEIHPGMRRSAKDIFDKVGDMAQNHLVQRGESLSRSSSVPLVEHPIDSSQESANHQPTVANMFTAQNKHVKITPNRADTPQPSRKEQKQSLILFEEVDILFDDDRGFWSGVQSLIHHSKRPVILTCNDPSNIPVDELDLHSTLVYAAPPDNIVVDYLAYLVASQGHLIDRESLLTLYRTKRKDLRAVLTELDFWCQMTVGSKMGGLDWFQTKFRLNRNTDNNSSRTFSQGTFHKGLDICPQSLDNIEDLLLFSHDCLEVEPTSWQISDQYVKTAAESGQPGEKFANCLCLLSSCESAMDLLGTESSTALAAEMLGFLPQGRFDVARCNLAEHLQTNGRQTSTPIQEVFECFDALMNEKPTFPPAQGRLAPSLDCTRASIATDVAPYVRSIAAFDQRLEHQRESLHGPPGKKSRTTRAARAAAEGGTKANTRSDRWFPRDLNLEQVLQTGHSWPQWIGSSPERESDLELSQADTETVDEDDSSKDQP